MNFVIVKHPNDNGKYLFRVPQGEVLDAGTLVTVNTRRGENQPGICATASFNADPETMCPLWGTQPHALQKVTKILREFELQWPEEPEQEDDDD